MISGSLRPEKQLRKAAKACDVLVPAARLLRLDIVEAELETLASSRLNRCQHARTASRPLLTVMAALLPSAPQVRWRDGWLGELHALPTRRSQARFAAHALSGIPRPAVPLPRPALRGRQARP